MLPDEINSRWDSTEEQVSKLTCIVMDTIHTKAQKEKETPPLDPLWPMGKY